MRKSVRILGQEYGLNSQEMNHILKEQGYLDGDTGDYTVTEKGVPFAEEQDFHRGTGGYAQYNRYWTTRTWDESIEDELNITDEMISDARKAVSEERKQHWDEIKAARAEADAAFLAKQNQDAIDSDEDGEPSDSNSDVLKAGLIIGGLIVLSYGVYKVAPHVVKWWKDSVVPKLSGGKKITDKKKITKKMICPSCGGTMKLNGKNNIWECDKCDYSISAEALNNGEVFWFCDKCETFMNTQPGFNTESGHWVCSKCGFDNDVSKAKIDE